jgi:hypothetical protein
VPGGRSRPEIASGAEVEGIFKLPKTPSGEINGCCRWKIEGPDPLRRRQCAGVETVTGQHDFCAARAGDQTDRGYVREHTTFEEAVFERPEPNVSICRAGEILGALAALAIVDLGGHNRALRQGAVLEVAAIFGELHEHSRSAGYPLNGGNRGQRRAFDRPAIRGLTVAQGMRRMSPRHEAPSIDTAASWAISIP